MDLAHLKIRLKRRVATELEAVLFTKLLRPGRFVVAGETYRYHWAASGRTWRHERALEVPYVLAAIAGVEDLLEVGNVLDQYAELPEHVVVDKYEVGPGIVNEDAATYQGGPFDAIVSISTLEHIGYDERPREPGKAAAAVANLRGLLRPGGWLLVTVPIGYNRDFDDFVLADPEAEVHTLVRTEDGPRSWRELPKENASAMYGYPYAGATILAFARWPAPTRPAAS